MMEEWKPIPNFPRNKVSNLGRISGHFVPIVALTRDKDGYMVFTRVRPDKTYNFKVHRLVYETFVGRIPDGWTINHKNGVRDDNRVENLEVMSNADNLRHSYRVLGRKGVQTNPCPGERNGNSRFKERDILKIRKMAKTMNNAEIGRKMGADTAVIWRIVTRQTWKHLP